MSVEIIAEIAQGYEGNATLARLLAKAAVCSGADAVKYQYILADEICTPDYQYYKFFKELEMPDEAWKEVAQIVKAGGKKLYFDVDDEYGLKIALELGADGVKIHATNFYNTDLVRAALNAMPKVFVSIGGISMEELEVFLKLHNISPGHQVCLIYGFQAEPTSVEANKLLRIVAIKKRFPGFLLGFMDHSDGASDDAQTLSLLALPLGVDFLEKHISLDRILEIEDYISAVAPVAFREFVTRIRRLESALGTDNLELTEVEKNYREKVLKVVVARVPLRKGEKIISESLALKRVGSLNRTPIYCKENAAGRTLIADVLPNQQVTKEMLS